MFSIFSKFRSHTFMSLKILERMIGLMMADVKPKHVARINIKEIILVVYDCTMSEIHTSDVSL